MPSRKKNDTEPVEPQTRMQTRVGNSNKHPGAVVQAASRVQRDPAVVQKEKEEKKARRVAKEQKLAQEEAADTDVEEYRSQQKLSARNEDNAFPRQRAFTKGT